MSAGCCYTGCLHAGRSAAYNGYAARAVRFPQLKIVLVPAGRINDTGNIFKLKKPAYAKFIAEDAGTDFLRIAGFCLVGPIRIGKQAAAESNKIGTAGLDYFFGNFRFDNAADCYNRYLNFLLYCRSQVGHACRAQVCRREYPGHSYIIACVYMDGIITCFFKHLYYFQPFCKITAGSFMVYT